MNATRSEEVATTALEVLQNWFADARPSPDVALAQADEARARGHITREEYLALLDAWPTEDAFGSAE